MSFTQSAPVLPHPLNGDPLLARLFARELSPTERAEAYPDLEALASYALDVFARRQSTRPEQPQLTTWNAWGQRVDHIEPTTAWREGAAIATRHGLIATGYDSALGAHCRLLQFIRVYLYHMASGFYTCALAITDGAMKTIEASGNAAITERVLPHYLSRDPDQLWLAAHWITEATGGSDVGHVETIARQDETGQWRLYGHKWLASSITSDTALVLARPWGAPDDAVSLALFFVETHHADGSWNGMTLSPLADTLGARELATAQVTLDGTLAQPLGAPERGVRMIAPALNICRTWNAVAAVASMNRCVALAEDYAHRRSAFGRRLDQQPLHLRTLAGMRAELAGAFTLSFHVAVLLGAVETGQCAPHDKALLRILTPLAKLWTGKLATSIASETLECFGGYGYLENTGLPQLLRDAQVYSIWEGTTNVLAIDLLRAIARNGLEPLREGIESILGCAHCNSAAEETIRTTLAQIEHFIDQHAANPLRMEAYARDLAITLARVTAAALLARDAAMATEDARASAALAIFLQHGLMRLNYRENARAVHTLCPSDPLA